MGVAGQYYTASLKKCYPPYYFQRKDKWKLVWIHAQIHAPKLNHTIYEGIKGYSIHGREGYSSHVKVSKPEPDSMVRLGNPRTVHIYGRFKVDTTVNMAVLDYIGKKYDGDQEKITLCYENQMNGGSCGVLMLQTCKNWQLESLAKLPPLLDVFVEEEDPYLNYEELENAIYEEGAYPASAEPSSNIEESVDDSSDIEGIDLGTFGQPIGPPLGFSRNDDEHNNFDDFDDL
ncbi:hypothetical protein SO802_005624 [Lithocarpus litseifolius]|uniref:Uncharacterized protein n=1 Tax=Lithocarpus litseifolius TaxID=425828 RepID=A0AAW2DNA3_9ROSI